MTVETEFAGSGGLNGHPAEEAAPDVQPEHPEEEGKTEVGEGEVGEGGLEPEPEVEPEELYAGKYKTREEFEAAYKELQSKFTGVSQDRAALIRERFTVTQPETPEAREEALRKATDGIITDPDAYIDSRVEAREQAQATYVETVESARKAADDALLDEFGDIPNDVLNEMERIFDTDQTTRQLFNDVVNRGNYTQYPDLKQYFLDQNIGLYERAMGRLVNKKVSNAGKVADRTAKEKYLQRTKQTTLKSGAKGAAHLTPRGAAKTAKDFWDGVEGAKP